MVLPSALINQVIFGSIVPGAHVIKIHQTPEKVGPLFRTYQW